MSISPDESSPSTPEGQSHPFATDGSLKADDVQIIPSAGHSPSAALPEIRDPALVALPVMDWPTGPSHMDLQRRLEKIHAAQYFAYKRKQLRTCLLLFFLTALSTFLVGSGYVPLEYLLAKIFPRFERYLAEQLGPLALENDFRDACRQGFGYSIPLMSILFFHEMGHYLQSLKNRVPASLPYFIPLPLPPMGTMGAVIFQGRGVATRRQMFDIAVSGPIAGLVLTLPVLWYGLSHSEYQPRTDTPSLEFGEPLLLQWMISAIHGAAPAGEVFMLNAIAFAGWVGVLVTALNLLPVGQLDGGHILYTLIGRKAHVVAYLVIGAGIISMMVRENYSFSLLLILLMLTGPRHPPTANDAEPLGLGRHIIGWLTLSFLIIGFTPSPIVS
jgi:Zn-dependent protease